MPDFTHLHVASAFSAHYGTARPESLVAAQKAAGAWAAAITDRDGLYGAVRHIRACVANGLQPVVGVDLALRETDVVSRRELDLAVKECAAFTEWLRPFVEQVGRREELRAIPLDRGAAAETLRAYVTSSP